MKLLLDGAAGEGGGQIVRTALGLSVATGIPFEMRAIRAGRKRPGLLRQHLTAVEAAARIGGARVGHARLHADRLSFEPSGIHPGDYAFDIQTAGSATLVLQAVLPPLLRAGAPTRLTLKGGTHNPLAPPFEFIAEVFFPFLRRMGADLDLELVSPGFFPEGGGELRVEIRPAELTPVDCLERGRVVGRRATAVVAGLPHHIAQRELAVVGKKLGWKKSELGTSTIGEGAGTGNVLMLRVSAEHATELVTGFGAPGLPAERVAERAARELTRYLKAAVPVGAHLADQILLPLALAGGGSFRTLPLSSHAKTNAALIERFCPVRFEVVEETERVSRVEVVS